MSMVGLKHYLRKRGGWFFFLSSRGFLNRMDDESYLKRIFRYSLGYAPDLDDPKTYNEKLQWLKLHDRRPLYTQLVDKLAVKDYVAEKLGPEYVIPVIGGPWDSADAIDFDALPEQFVLKCTHDSGGVVICRGKAEFDREAAKAKLAKSLGRNFFWANREWPYRDVTPRIFAEKYVEDDSGALRDYKVFTFHGEPFCVQADFDRFINHRRNYYDLDWKPMPFSYTYPSDPAYALAAPACLEEMLRLVRGLSSSVGAPFLRVDFYVVAGRPLFGELTFYSDSGLGRFDPPEWDQRLGALIHLPTDGGQER